MTVSSKCKRPVEWQMCLHIIISLKCGTNTFRMQLNQFFVGEQHVYLFLARSWTCIICYMVIILQSGIRQCKRRSGCCYLNSFIQEPRDCYRHWRLHDNCYGSRCLWRSKTEAQISDP